MIRKLLYKELKLSASPLSYLFIAFMILTMVPSYPILIGAFFVCLGIFHTFQQTREYNDITYTAMLPVKKKDAVKAKYLFVLFIELMAFTLCILLTVIRMVFLGYVEPYASNMLMNANMAYLGYVLLVFSTFNGIFLAGFFRTVYKIGIPYILFALMSFGIVAVGEMLHHVSGLESLNYPYGVSAAQMVVFGIGMTVFVLGTWTSYQNSVKNFERIDL